MDLQFNLSPHFRGDDLHKGGNSNIVPEINLILEVFSESWLSTLCH